MEEYIGRDAADLRNMLIGFSLGFLCCLVVLGRVTDGEYKLPAEANHLRKHSPPFSLVWFKTYTSR